VKHSFNKTIRPTLNKFKRRQRIGTHRPGHRVGSTSSNLVAASKNKKHGRGDRIFDECSGSDIDLESEIFHKMEIINEKRVKKHAKKF